jgi:hypothetical protein
MDSSLDLSANIIFKEKSLELCFDKDIICKSPILTYSRGFFYFFNDVSNFEKIVNNLGSKPFYDRLASDVRRELVGEYCCDLTLVEDSVYSLNKLSRSDRSYDSLRDRILSCEDSTRLGFKVSDGYHVSKFK